MNPRSAGRAIGGALKQFGLFWYRFTIGDDAVGAGIAIAGMVGTWLLSRTGIPAWWLLPVVVMASVIVSLSRRARRADTTDGGS